MRWQCAICKNFAHRLNWFIKSEQFIHKLDFIVKADLESTTMSIFYIINVILFIVNSCLFSNVHLYIYIYKKKVKNRSVHI